jgi:hypothetical protein
MIVPNSGITEKEYWSYSLCSRRLGKTKFGKRHGNGGDDALCKHGIGDLVEFETGKCTARLEHAVRLAEDIRDRGDVADAKGDSV